MEFKNYIKKIKDLFSWETNPNGDKTVNNVLYKFGEDKTIYIKMKFNNIKFIYKSFIFKIINKYKPQNDINGSESMNNHKIYLSKELSEYKNIIKLILYLNLLSITSREIIHFDIIIDLDFIDNLNKLTKNKKILELFISKFFIKQLDSYIKNINFYDANFYSKLLIKHNIAFGFKNNIPLLKIKINTFDILTNTGVDNISIDSSKIMDQIMIFDYFKKNKLYENNYKEHRDIINNSISYSYYYNNFYNTSNTHSDTYEKNIPNDVSITKINNMYGIHFPKINYIIKSLIIDLKEKDKDFILVLYILFKKFNIEYNTKKDIKNFVNIVRTYNDLDLLDILYLIFKEDLIEQNKNKNENIEKQLLTNNNIINKFKSEKDIDQINNYYLIYNND